MANRLETYEESQGAQGDYGLQHVHWSPLRILVVGLCFIVNAVDGMDVLVLSYVAPTLQQDWHIGADELGALFSVGILGMAIGGLALAPLADVLGRRLVIIVSFATSTLAMLLSGSVTTVGQLMLLRVLVGIGIGCALASMAALVAEYAPPRQRTLAVGLLYGGYPLGAIVTGFVAARAIPEFGWKSVLTGTGAVALIVLPVLFGWLPESLEFLVKRRPAQALPRLNRILGRMKVTPLLRLPDLPPVATTTGVAGLFAAGRARSTILLWAAMILGYASLWFAISWIPKLATLVGLDPANAIYAGTSFNAGAFLGTVALGLVTARLRLQSTIALFLSGAAVAMILFGAADLTVPGTMMLAFAIGFLLQGGFNGIYPLGTQLYPAEVRGTGIGWTMGIGRVGAVLGPVVGGLLIKHQVPVGLIFLAFAIPAILGGVCAAFVSTAPAAARSA